MLTAGVMPLGLACVSAPLKKSGISVEILDLNLEKEPQDALEKKITSSKPDIIGITFTTPLFDIAKLLADIIKKIDSRIVTVCGGPHVSTLPKETLEGSGFDIAVLSEGEYSFMDIVAGKPLAEVNGIAYRSGEDFIINEPVGHIEDLDALPFARVDLFEASKYRYPRVTARKNPVASLETSRGCFARCSYCNKSVFGYRFRAKSARRVVDEMEFVLSKGYKEIHIIDDGFTTDMGRASEICAEIRKRGLRFPWYVRGGVRVDRVSRGLLKDMKNAGCYRVPYGVESGDQRVLDGIKKGITLKQAENAVTWAKDLGMIVDAYFMLGLPNETARSIEKSIEFARALDPDYVKFAITVPLPGTELFDELKKKGAILTEDWNKYHFAISPRQLYRHENIGWDELEGYYKAAYRKFYMRPKYILKRFFTGLRRGELPAYIRAFFDFKKAVS